MQDYWQKQTPNQPLFPDLVWSRPENKNQAGKLLIIGGNAHGFAAAAEAYNIAIKSGIGTARVLLPDSLQKTVGKVFEVGEYAPSTPSGSFSKRALSEILIMAQWADGMLLAGDFGRNSETAILLEEVVQKFSGQITITQDALDYFTKHGLDLLNKPNILIVASFAQLQKIAAVAHYTSAFTFEMPIIKLVETLHDFSQSYSLNIITKHLDTILVATKGQISSTKLEVDQEIWRVKTAASAAVWWLQNTDKTFEALSTSLT